MLNFTAALFMCPWTGLRKRYVVSVSSIYIPKELYLGDRQENLGDSHTPLVPLSLCTAMVATPCNGSTSCAFLDKPCALLRQSYGDMGIAMILKRCHIPWMDSLTTWKRY